jgi:putative transposase
MVAVASQNDRAQLSPHRQHPPRASPEWRLDEMVIRIRGQQMYLWRAVNHEAEILDMT